MGEVRFRMKAKAKPTVFRDNNSLKAIDNRCYPLYHTVRHRCLLRLFTAMILMLIMLVGCGPSPEELEPGSRRRQSLIW